MTPDIFGKSLSECHPGAQLPETLKDKKSRVGVYRKTKEREYVVDMARVMIGNQIIGVASVCAG